MELRDLRSFAAVVRTGSFTAAARELGYTQSAVSQHVANLEASVGRPLLTRRPVRVTTIGARLAEHAAHVILRLDVAQSELAVIDDATRDARVAMTPLVDARRLAASLRTVRATSPATSVRLAAMSADAAVASVAVGDSDIALVDGIVAPGNPLVLADAGLLASSLVAESELGVVVPRDHPLRGDSVDLDALTDVRWIDAPQLVTAPAGVPVPRPGALRGPRHDLVYDGTDVLALLELVAAGHGLVLLPTRVCVHVPGVRALRIGGPPGLIHRVELLLLRNATSRLRDVVDAIRAAG